MDKILYRPNFLPKETCEKYVDFLKKTNTWEKNGDGVWSGRSINLSTMDSSLREEMLDLRIRVKQELQSFYKTQKSMYADIFQFVKWNKGNSLHPHADSENPDGSPHPYPWRNYAAIIYLNDDYRGGKTYFPNFNNFSPDNSPGSLVSFPGNLEYLHGVTEVFDNTRYTIASFFTYDESKRDKFRI